jgi:hypothetical protein
MTATAEQLNRDLLALTESFANAGIGPAEFRRRRRELICSWTGQPVPQPDVSAPSEDDTHPGLKPITDEQIKEAASAPEVAVAAAAENKGVRWGLWVTLLLLVFAFSGAAAVLWFVLRRSV